MNETTDTPVPFGAKLRALFTLSKTANNNEKKVVLVVARQIMQSYAEDGCSGISFSSLESRVLTHEVVKTAVRTSAFPDAFNYATAVLIAQGVSTRGEGNQQYFYWDDSQ